MATVKLRDQLTGFRVERGKQGRRAVPFVVMRPALDLTWPHRQQRLRAVERLDLRFFVHAEDDRVVWRVHVEPHNVPDCRSAADPSTA
jgi:hypothetical protein